MSTDRVRLSDLPEGSTATFVAADVDTPTRRHLGSLGLTADCPLRLCKSGEPFIVAVRGTRIGMSATLARSIFVISPPAGSA